MVLKFTDIYVFRLNLIREKGAVCYQMKDTENICQTNLYVAILELLSRTGGYKIDFLGINNYIMSNIIL